MKPCVYFLPAGHPKPLFFTMAPTVEQAHSIAKSLQLFFGARAFVADYWRCAWVPDAFDRHREAIGTHACTDYVDAAGVCTICGARELTGSEVVDALRASRAAAAARVEFIR